MRNKCRSCRIICLILVLVMCACMSGCTSFDNFKHTFLEDNSANNEDVIYIGVFEPKTGAQSEKGNNEIKGIELAHSIYSNVKGANVELVYVDTQSDTAASEAAIKNLIELNPIAIIGSCGEASSMIASEYVEANKIPTITPSAVNPLITESNDYYFRACITESQRGAGLADYACEKLGAQRIGIISIKNNSYGDAIVDGFRSAVESLREEDAVVLNTRITIDETDASKVVSKLIASGTDVVFMPVGVEKADMIFTEVENANLTNIKFLGNQEWNTDEFVKMMEKHPAIKVAFPSDNVVIKNSTTKGSVTAETQRFLVEYSKKYGSVDTPTDSTVLGYDSYLLIINAINNAEELTPESVRDALASTDNLRCATGVFSFDADGNPVRTVNISTIHDGQIVSAYVSSDVTEAEQMKKIEK